MVCLFSFGQTRDGGFAVVYQVLGIVLPQREECSLWIDGEVLRTGPSAIGDLVVDGGWILPGLVDVHTHPGTENTGDPFDEEVLRKQLLEHRDAGVLAVRTPGSAARMPRWIDDDPTLPVVLSAGPWLATPGRFFPGFGRHITEDDLVASCLEEVRASGSWCKVIGDWMPDQEPVSAEILKAAATAVHQAGGKIAVHCQTAEGCRNAVMACVDSIEHGMHLDAGLLDQMARQGTALVPTITAFGGSKGKMLSREPSPFRDWWLAGWEQVLPIARQAYEAGVTVLAGTDGQPFGNVATEVMWLLKAGLPAEAALGAASWTARKWLGLPGLEDGATANLVVYDADPLTDPAVLASPSRIIVRGRIIR